MTPGGNSPDLGRCGLALLVAGCLLSAAEPVLSVIPGSPGGVYAAGERITWLVAWRSTESPPRATFAIDRGAATRLASGDLDLRPGQAVVSASLDQPGTVLMDVVVPGADGHDLHACGGALVEPDLIRPAEPRPADFDDFWAAKLTASAAIPMNPLFTVVAVDDPTITYGRLTLDGFAGSRIHGQLARPRDGGRLPAMLIVPWAGVYGQPKEFVLQPARQGWLALNISAHDLPIDGTEDFYRQQAETTLKGYPAIGCDDRERSYFLRMFLACSRAVDYLAQRPDWDGRTILVAGTSQGGLLAIAAAALNPKVSAIIADQPAGCDHAGSHLGRAPGWPRWWDNAGGRDPARVRETARYFDAVHLAPRVTCPALVSVGLIDPIARPEGILAAYNLLRGPKELVVMPLAGHRGGQAPCAARMAAWQDALRAGAPLPIPSR